VVRLNPHNGKFCRQKSNLYSQYGFPSFHHWAKPGPGQHASSVALAQQHVCTFTTTQTEALASQMIQPQVLAASS